MNSSELNSNRGVSYPMSLNGGSRIRTRAENFIQKNSIHSVSYEFDTGSGLSNYNTFHRTFLADIKHRIPKGKDIQFDRNFSIFIANRKGVLFAVEVA